MLLYYSLFVYLLLMVMIESSIRNINKKLILILCMGILGVLVCFRSPIIGNDTETYLMLFNTINFSDDLSYFYDRYERGYIWLNKLISYISGDPQYLLIIIGIITTVGYSRFILKNSKSVAFSVLLFVLMGYFGQTMNTLRMQLALVILLLSFEFIKKNSPIKFMALVALAFLFHKTAIVFILAYPLSRFKYSKKLLISIIAGSIMMLVFLTPVLEWVILKLDYYTDYSSSVYSNGNIRLATVLQIILSIFVITIGLFVRSYYVKPANVKVSLENKFNNYDVMLLFSILSLGITIISLKFNLLDRCSMYFAVFNICWIPNLIKEITNSKVRVSIMLLVILIYGLYFTTIQLFRPDWNDIYPYVFWKN